MRWLALWLLLTGVYLLGWALSRPFTGGSWEITDELLAHLAAVPLVQAVSLWVVAVVRRSHQRKDKRAAERLSATPAGPDDSDPGSP
jgi:membrane protein implicated in regulation of membrane protease activity